MPPSTHLIGAAAVLAIAATAAFTLVATLGNDREPVLLSDIPSEYSPPLDRNDYQRRLEAATAFVETRFERDKNRDTTWFSGWMAYPTLSTYLDGFLLTNDNRWLHEFLRVAEHLIAMRADHKGIENYAGFIEPQWYRGEDDTIFGHSPFYSFDAGDKPAIMEARGWVSLYFSDVNHDGLFIDQMARFAALVRERQLNQFEPDAARLLNSIRETINSHEPQWNSEGFYVFAKGSPYFVDGAEIPINEAAFFGSALVYMYEATGEQWYLDRAEAMMNRWLSALHRHNGLPVMPYTMGNWAEGWTEADEVSVNAPIVEPHQQADVFRKTAITVHFAQNLSKHIDNPDLDRFVDDLPVTLETAADYEGEGVSFFPHLMDMSAPKDSRYAYNPAHWRGWAETSAIVPDAWRLMLLETLFQLDESPAILSSPLFVLMLDQPDGAKLPLLKTTSFSVRPPSHDEPAHCLFRVETDTVIKLASDGSSTLFLSPSPDSESRISLLPDDEQLSGRAALRAGECAEWQWIDGSGAVHVELYQLVDPSSTAKRTSNPAATNAQSSS